MNRARPSEGELAAGKVNQYVVVAKHGRGKVDLGIKARGDNRRRADRLQWNMRFLDLCEWDGHASDQDLPRRSRRARLVTAGDRETQQGRQMARHIEIGI